jgi:hypothetical protein
MSLTNREAGYLKSKQHFEYENPLHDFASYNTLFTLSGLTENEIRNPEQYIKNPVHDVIARSSGIGDAFTGRITDATAFSVNRATTLDSGGITGVRADRIIQRDEYLSKNELYQQSVSILRRNHDVFIEDVNMLSTIGPNNDRNLANFTKMTFKVHEPYSITLIEKIRAATFVNGYLDYQDAPLLLTIEFKGFDENSRPVRPKQNLTRKIPILIVRVDFDVNQGGAMYEITAVPYGDAAHDDRFKVARTSIPVNINYWTSWVSKVQTALNKMMQDEIDEEVRQYPDTYRFEIEDGLLGQARQAFVKPSTQNDADPSGYQWEIQNAEDQQLADDIAYRQATETSQTLPKGTSLLKAMEDWIRAQPGFMELSEDFWRAYLTMAGVNLDEDEKVRTTQIRNLLTTKEKEGELSKLLLENQYLPWFKIKTSIYTDTGRLDKITKMHPKEIVYKAVSNKVHVLKFLASGMSLGRTNWTKLVRKNYDYMYTGDNVDVQGLRINYKSAYYMRNVRRTEETPNDKSYLKVIKIGFKKVFGEEDYPEPMLPLRSYPSTLKGRSTSNPDSPLAFKQQEFYDYLTNPEADMMRVELDILGDPHYICQDMYTTLKRLNDRNTSLVVGRVDEDFDNQGSDSFNGDRYTPLINIRYRLPADVDERKGTMFSAQMSTQEDNLFFNGVYQVVKVESRFDQGQFLQTLTCVRMNNQQGAGLAPTITTTVFDNKYVNKKKKTVAQEGGTMAGEAGLPEISGDAS